jgi:molybdenum cofactor cytidylyltransferase
METILLAAGHSKRMGEGKLLLPFKGEPLLIHALRGALEGSSKVVVVTNEETEELLNPFKEEFGDKLLIVLNHHSEWGQFYSTQLGVKHLSSGAPFFLALGDLPLIRGEHYGTLKKELSNWEGVRPFYQGNPGHPVLCAPHLATAIREAPRNATVHSLLEGREIYNYESEDEAWVVDVDTPQAYEELLKNYGG